MDEVGLIVPQLSHLPPSLELTSLKTGFQARSSFIRLSNSPFLNHLSADIADEAG
jgi:hypothetical protein